MNDPTIIRIGPGEHVVTVLTEGGLGLRKRDSEVFLEFVSADAALDFCGEVAESARWFLGEEKRTGTAPRLFAVADVPEVLDPFAVIVAAQRDAEAMQS